MKRFTKKALPLAVAAAMVPGFASAAEVSGYADVFYNVSSDSAPTTDGLFTATGELNFTAAPADGVTVRMDVDLSLATNGGANASAATGGPADSGVLEQAYFAWGVTEGVTVLGGVFNNPIGAEAEDAPDINFNSHGVVYNILDNQTALHGDNVAGLAGAFAVGPATITIAYLDDIGLVAEKNSIAAVVNFAPIEGLDLELGYVTQEAGAENVMNFNAIYTGVEDLTVGLDYLAADKVVDSAYEFFALYNIGAIGVGARFETITWESGANDSTRTTLRASYQVASNLTAALDIADGSDAGLVGGIINDQDITLELIATF